MRNSILVSCLFPLALSACGQSEPETLAGACAPGVITASDAWVRAAEEGRPMSAGYVSLCNGNDAADRLVSASFEGANATELHATTMSDEGVASMDAIEGLALPVGDAVALAPGGAHIMLIGLSDTLEAGDEAKITLTFETAPEQTILFEIRDRTDASGHTGH